MNEIMPIYDSIERHTVEWIEDEDNALDAYLERAEAEFWANHRVAWTEEDEPIIIED